MKEIIEKISRISLPKPDAGRDRALWKQGPDIYQEKFVSKSTWDLLHFTKDKVVWFNIGWFSQAIPRQAFITELAYRNILDTGDRVRLWGHTQICLFWGEPNETRDHLFFACPYTYTVRTMLFSRFLGSRINLDWTRTIASLKSNRLTKLDAQLVKMDFQASINWIWRERNGRRHLHPPNSLVYIARTFHREIKNRLQTLHQGNTDGDDIEGLRRWNSLTMLP